MAFISALVKWLSDRSAQPGSCFMAFLTICLWAASGPILNFDTTWHLLINTTAAIIAIVMLFVIQNSQNRHTIAIQLKLDEIIRATQGAHNEMMDIEKLTDADILKIQIKYGLLAEKTRADLREGKIDTHTPDIINIQEEKK
jgi:low affinity Fe/Cu permease